MILAHSIVGLLLGKKFGYFWFWFIGSVIPDVDHIAVLCKHRIFSWRKIIDAMRHEDRYGIRFKTKYVHSICGALIAGGAVAVRWGMRHGFYFFLAYLGHLLLDWPDQDEKQFFWPLSSRTFRGFLPIFSKIEIVLTAGLVLALILL